MTTLFGPILAAALMAQIQGGPLEGTVVDDQGKPVCRRPGRLPCSRTMGARRSSPWRCGRRPMPRAGSVCTYPPLGRDYISRARVWAYRPGSAITAVTELPAAPALVLRKPEPRTVKIEGPDGQPVAGARISACGSSSSPPASSSTKCPTRWPRPLAVTTGPDGKATLNYLAAGDQSSVAAQSRPIRSALRTSSSSNGPAATLQGATITIRLKPTSRLAGRVRNRAGQPVADQIVEVWSKGGSVLEPNPVGFKNGPTPHGR